MFLKQHKCKVFFFQSVNLFATTVCDFGGRHSRSQHKQPPRQNISSTGKNRTWSRNVLRTDFPGWFLVQNSGEGRTKRHSGHSKRHSENPKKNKQKTNTTKNKTNKNKNNTKNNKHNKKQKKTKLFLTI